MIAQTFFSNSSAMAVNPEEKNCWQIPSSGFTVMSGAPGK